MRTVLSADEIRQLLPHRWPFLLLDRVIELDPGKAATGIKNVSVNEPYFQGHFPHEYIMPGVLIVEALAQLTAIVYCQGVLSEIAATSTSSQLETPVGPLVGKFDAKEPDVSDIQISSLVGYLVAIKAMKFKRPAVPGDQLVLKSRILSTFGILSQVSVTAHIRSEIAAEGVLIVSQRPANEGA